ncbi:MAG: DUF371 domain-containing protein [Methanocorpusculum sp.]|nr:DUF371 domain-containing protein [Methanocorpusculum sp.]MDD4132380.1 DUF371 domain-containing protein [Methanocorpusculum sp.]
MLVTEIIHCHGHKNVRALHKYTFEVTKETELSPKGDCIIGVGADKGAVDLSPEFHAAIAKNGAILITTLTCGEISVQILSEGAADITLTHPTDLVWRRSAFVCPRTVAIYSDHTAKLLPRELVTALQSGAEMTVTLTIEEPQ